jgi:hypothetical protein
VSLSSSKLLDIKGHNRLPPRISHSGFSGLQTTHQTQIIFGTHLRTTQTAPGPPNNLPLLTNQAINLLQQNFFSYKQKIPINIPRYICTLIPPNLVPFRVLANTEFQKSNPLPPRSSHYPPLQKEPTKPIKSPSSWPFQLIARTRSS